MLPDFQNPWSSRHMLQRALLRDVLLSLTSCSFWQRKPSLRPVPGQPCQLPATTYKGSCSGPSASRALLWSFCSYGVKSPLSH